MSENSITVVEISIKGTEAQERAAALREWLIAAGVVVPNASRDPRWEPSEFAAGPAVSTVFDAEDHAKQLNVSNSGVDILTKRQVFHPGENYHPPSCPSCSTPIDEETHEELVDEWLDGTEPLVACQNCGASALLGDWPGQWTSQVGELAVTFNNWPPLSDGFMADIGRRLGDRWRVVYEHY